MGICGSCCKKIEIKVNEEIVDQFEISLKNVPSSANLFDTKTKRKQYNEKAYMQLLEGNYDRAFELTCTSEIRIFISSTIKDYHLERNYLIENVYDEMKKECYRKYKKDLFVSSLQIFCFSKKLKIIFNRLWI